MSAGYQPGKAPIIDADDGRAYVSASVNPGDEQAAVEYFNKLMNEEGFPLHLSVSIAVMHFISPDDEGTFRDKRVQARGRNREDVQR